MLERRDGAGAQRCRHLPIAIRPEQEGEVPQAVRERDGQLRAGAQPLPKLTPPGPTDPLHPRPAEIPELAPGPGDVREDNAAVALPPPAGGVDERDGIDDVVQ